jgi:aminoglycoside phosphotransferase (APT) family kinase protein
MKTSKEAEKYLEELEKFKDIQFISKEEGKHNINFIFNSERGKIVLRSRKDVVDQDRCLENEMKVLNFLEHQGLEFAPESIFYDKGSDAHIIEFSGETQVEIKELEESELEEWVSHLAKLHGLDFENYKDFCKSQGYDCSKVKSVSGMVQGFLADIEQSDLDHSVLEWTRERIQELQSKLKNHDFETIGLSHNDLPHSTRRGRHLYLVDWEFACFTEAPEMELAKIRIGEDISSEKFSSIKDIYREERGIEDLDSKLDLGEEVNRLLTLSWLIKRASNLKEREDEEWKRYLESAQEKKENYIEFQSKKVFKNLEETDKVLFNDRAQPLTVEEVESNFVLVSGPKGGRYEIYVDEGTLLVCKEGGRRYSSYCKNLRKVGEWVRNGDEWSHSISDACVWLEEDENGFWTVGSNVFEPDNPRYGFSSKEYAVEEAEKIIRDNPSGKKQSGKT